MTNLTNCLLISSTFVSYSIYFILGIPCPTPNERICTPCDYTWSAWGACNSTTGRQFRSPIIHAQPTHGGTACPTLTEEQDCPINCVFSFADSAWLPATCTEEIEQTQQIVVSTLPLNGGAVCPEDNKRQCKPCSFSYASEWLPATCASILEQTQSVIVSALPENGGTVCPEDNKRQCKPCVFSFAGSEWLPATCTVLMEQTQSVVVNASPENGGTVCPEDNKRQCKPCSFTWEGWTTCDVATGKQVILFLFFPFYYYVKSF